MALVYGQNLYTYEILMRYLNPRLTYYYFRFWKTDVRHIVILLPVSILTYSRYRDRKLHRRRTKFHPNRSTHGGVMTSYRFLKLAAISSQIYFRLWLS